MVVIMSMGIGIRISISIVSTIIMFLMFIAFLLTIDMTVAIVTAIAVTMNPPSATLYFRASTSCAPGAKTADEIAPVQISPIDPSEREGTH